MASLWIGRVTLECADADGADLVKQTAMSAEAGTTGGWQPIAAVILCLEGTTSLAIVLDCHGGDAASFQDITRRGSLTDYPTASPISEEELKADEDNEPTDEELAEGRPQQVVPTSTDRGRVKLV